MKICILSNALAVHTQRWAKAYAERGNEVHLLSIRHADIPSVKVHTVRLGPANSGSVGWTFLSYFWLLVTAWWRLKKIAPDILHAHYVVTHGVIAAFSGFHPWVVSAWGKDVIWDKQGSMPWHLRLMNRFALRDADLVCSTSQYMIGHLREFVRPNCMIEQVPFGVNCERFRPVKSEGTKICDRKEFRIGFVKTLSTKYGPHVLIRAMQRIVEALPHAQLIMAGRGPLLEELQGLVRNMGLDDHVKFVGFVPNDEVSRLMQTFDVFVNCSVCPESFGVAILEASSCGLPVVATRVGGVSEVCRDGETGIMVDPNDSGALAKAIIQIAKDPELREKMGRDGRSFVLQNYVWQNNVRRMQELLGQLVGI